MIEQLETYDPEFPYLMNLKCRLDKPTPQSIFG